MRAEKIIIFLICTSLLVSCRQIAEESKNSVASGSSTLSSDTDLDYPPKTVSEAAVDVERTAQDKYKELKWQIKDLRNKKRQISFFETDLLENSCVEMELSYYATQYSQVKEDDYYYARYTGDAQYSIYRNTGEFVGKFNLQKEQYIYGYAKYGDIFYVNIGAKDINNNYKDFFCRVDMEKEKVDIIYEYPDWSIKDSVLFCNSKIYINDYEVLDICGKRDRILSFNEKDNKQIQYVLNNKMYLSGVKEAKDIVFYCYDIDEKSREEYFRYSFDSPNSKWKFDSAELEVKHGDIYICEIYYDGGISYRKKLYMIPAKTQKMQKVSDDYIENYAVAKKYVFYTDSNHKIHKYSISTQKDSIIGDIKAMDIACTKEGLYVQKYNEDLVDSESNITDDSSCGLYFMDFDGKNVVEIEKEKIEIE